MKKLLFVLLALGSLVAPASAQSGSVDAFVELLRSDIKTQKVSILTEVMEFTTDQASVFWPIYRDYEKDSAKLTDLELNLLKEYAGIFDSMTDTQAKEMSKRFFKLEEDKLKLRKKYHDKVAGKLGAAEAAKFSQIDNQINSLIELQLYSNLPLFQKAK